MYKRVSGRSLIRTTFLCSLCILSVMAVFFLLPGYGHASENDGREAFKKGRQFLESAQYDSAVQYLTIAQKEYPLLADYALLYLAEAFHGLGMHEKALITARALIGQYPSSPLLRKARQSEIREMTETEKDALAPVFEAYAKEYPDDDETPFFYARFLKKEGDAAKAKTILKQIFRKGGTQSERVRAELDPSELTAADILERSLNLMKRYDFCEAEDELRRALSLDQGTLRDEILRNLAYTLFKQKKYRDAAALYDRIHDTYFMARSLYRSGDYEGFNEALSQMIAKDDRRAGFLLLTVASDRRREKDYESALGVFGDIAAKYPSEAEEALWGTGWTYYLARDYEKAAGVFAKLSDRYDEPKYRYWQARSLESDGKDPSLLYRSLAKVENNYYGLLASFRDRRPVKPVSYTLDQAPAAPSRPAVFERVDALRSFSLQKEAVAEIIHASKKITSQGDLLSIMGKLHELGEYSREIGLAAKLPYTNKLHRFWYPLGFQEIIEPVSKRLSFDPYITLSVIREESRFDPDAVSPAGARGLMQLMPQTAFRLDKKLKLGVHRISQIHDINNNITLGTYYLKSLVSEFNSLAHAIAAYNAGEAMVRKWARACDYRSVDEFIEDIPYGETRNYVKKVLTSYFQYRKSSANASEQADVDLFSMKR